MNKYQACQQYHEANGFLQAKQTEEMEENKESLILYVQELALNKIVKPLSTEIFNALDSATINHLLELNCNNSDEMEEAIQILTNISVLEDTKTWYQRNKHAA